MNRNIQITPEGTRDLLFEECLARRRVERTLGTLFKAHGYNKVITPTMEFADVYYRDSAGQPPETLYSLIDAQGRMLALRADSTLPIARVAATRLREAAYPLRLYYNQSVFRRSPRYAGMRDESSQSGVELIGAQGLRADLEIIALAAEALAACGAPDFKIEIGHAGFFRTLIRLLPATAEMREELSELFAGDNYSALNDLLDTIGDSKIADALRALPRLFGGKEVLQKARGFCDDAEALQALDYLQSILERLEAAGLADKVNLDLGLVHRGNYYTGIVLRGYIEGSGLTVLSGGRYDRLLAEFGKDLPAIGFGVEAGLLADAMLARGEVEPPAAAEVLVFAQTGSEMQGLARIQELCCTGVVCENAVCGTIEEAKAYAAQKGIALVEHVTQNGVLAIAIPEDA